MKDLFKLNEAGQPLALPWIEMHIPFQAIANRAMAIMEERPMQGANMINKALAVEKRMYELYKSPFDPSQALTGDKKLFDGWEYHPDSGYWNSFKARMDKAAKTISNYDEDCMIGGNYPGIQTISQFIEICTLAGVPLTWTPYAVGLMTGTTCPVCLDSPNCREGARIPECPKN